MTDEATDVTITHPYPNGTSRGIFWDPEAHKAGLEDAKKIDMRTKRSNDRAENEGEDEDANRMRKRVRV